MIDSHGNATSCPAVSTISRLSVNQLPNNTSSLWSALFCHPKICRSLFEIRHTPMYIRNAYCDAAHNVTAVWQLQPKVAKIRVHNNLPTRGQI